MCDYSLAGIPNRLAVEGEQLVVHRFSTDSLGLASPCSPPLSKETPAVCIPPGARLRLRDIPQDLQLRFGLNEIEEVTFVSVSGRGAIPKWPRSSIAKTPLRSTSGGAVPRCR